MTTKGIFQVTTVSQTPGVLIQPHSGRIARVGHCVPRIDREGQMRRGSF